MKLLEPDEDLGAYVGYQMRITKDGAGGGFKGRVYEGTFRGRSPLQAIKAIEERLMGPFWLLDSDGEEQHFHHPGDGWHICVFN
jgi:hypothetical protein